MQSRSGINTHFTETLTLTKGVWLVGGRAGFEWGLHATELIFTLPLGEWGLRATVAGKSAFLVEEGRKGMGEHQTHWASCETLGHLPNFSESCFWRGLFLFGHLFVKNAYEI